VPPTRAALLCPPHRSRQPLGLPPSAKISKPGYPLLTYIADCGIRFVMIKVRLRELLEERGRTLYWLWKRTGVRYATVWQMGKGEVGRLNMDVLDRICEALECQPGDLLVRVTGRKAAKKKRR
jgi:putative transcriptional regulator